MDSELQPSAAAVRGPRHSSASLSSLPSRRRLPIWLAAENAATVRPHRQSRTLSRCTQQTLPEQITRLSQPTRQTSASSGAHSGRRVGGLCSARAAASVAAPPLMAVSGGGWPLRSVAISSR
jgi:hypothetical protein